MRTARSVGSNEDWRRPASMREKSSRLLTSRRSRSALRWTASRSSPRSALRGIRERVLERAEDQRQRRAKLVAHVAEECGLRAVELGELLGALALLLVGARVGDRRRDVARHELEEAPVVVVERSARADAEHEHARRAASSPGARWAGASPRARVRPRVPWAGSRSGRPGRRRTPRGPRSPRVQRPARRVRLPARRRRAGSRRSPARGPA